MKLEIKGLTPIVGSSSVEIKIRPASPLLIRGGRDPEKELDPRKRAELQEDIKTRGYLVEVSNGLSSIWVNSPVNLSDMITACVYLDGAATKTKSGSIAFRPTRLRAVEDATGKIIDLVAAAAANDLPGSKKAS